MNERGLRTLFPHASPGFLAANAQGAGAAPLVECPPRDGALGAGERKEGDAGRVFVRFVSVRKRLLDPDNLSEKWLLDCLRFAGIIPGDEPERLSLETTQRKAAKGEAEHTLIEVYG